MAVDAAGVERALGSIGTAFRLARLYPPTHPAVIEALRHVSTALPGLAALGTVEWKVGATGLHWHGQQLVPRNAQVAELAGLLYARGIRVVQAHPGVTADHVLALFAVARGTLLPDDASLGRLILSLGRRVSQRLAGGRASSPAAAPPAATAAPTDAPAPAAVEPLAGARSTAAFRPDVLPPDLEARRAVTALAAAETPAEQRGAVEKLGELATDLLALRDITVVAEVIAALDAALPRVTDPAVQQLVGQVAGTLATEPVVARMVARLGEPRVPPGEREALVKAVGALAAVTVTPVVQAFVQTAPDLREPYRAAVRIAADRAVEPLQALVADSREEIVAAAAQFLGLTGGPAVVAQLLELVRHPRDTVREAALLALVEIGAREAARPAIPSLKDESALVRIAAARLVGVAGDPSATTVLVRRLDQEMDEGVVAELLRAIGRLGAPEALEVLARYAEPGGRRRGHTAFVRAAAIEGLGRLSGPEGRALVELYRQDKDPAVKRAAEAALQ